VEERERERGIRCEGTIRRGGGDERTNEEEEEEEDDAWRGTDQSTNGLDECTRV
jgi:hypothetical protein